MIKILRAFILEEYDIPLMYPDDRSEYPIVRSTGEITSGITGLISKFEGSDISIPPEGFPGTQEAWTQIIIDAAKLGSIVHGYLENVANGNENNYKGDSIPMKNAVMAWDSLLRRYKDYKLYAEEFVAYNTLLSPIDLLAYNEKTKHIVILDYKTSANIYDSHKLQLNIYKFMLEKILGKGYKIDMYLVWVKKKEIGPELIKVKDDPKTLKKFLEFYESKSQIELLEEKEIELLEEKLKEIEKAP